MRRRVHFDATRAGHVKDLFVRLAALFPPLDHLQALQWRRLRIRHRPRPEAGRAITLRLEVRPHRDPLGVGGRHAFRRFEERLIEVVAREEPDLDPRSRGREGLLATKRRIDRLARVLLGPDRRHAGSPPELERAELEVGLVVDFAREGGREEAQARSEHATRRDRSAPLRRSVDQACLAPVLVFALRASAHVGVGRADEAELVGVGHALRRDLEASAIGVAHVAAFGLARSPRSDPEGHDFEVGPFVGIGEQGMRFRRALHLGHLDERLVPHPLLGVGVVDRLSGPVRAHEHRPVRTV